MSAADTFAPILKKVAIELLGQPDKVEHGGMTLRWGTYGSFKIDVDKGVWHDKEANEGGGTIALVEREAGTDKAGALQWLQDRSLIPPPESKEPIFYDYRDETGTVLFRVERKGSGASKSFLQHGPDGNGGFAARAGGMKGVRRVPYRLPELIAADPAALVFITEGEKDAGNLAQRGLIATTNPGGAGKFPADFAPFFEGRRVIILADNDQAGIDHAEDVAGKLRGIAAALTTLTLPGADKSDVSDWLAAGGSAFQLNQMAEEKLAAGRKLLPIVDFEDWQGPAPARRSAWGDLLPLGVTTMLTGEGGVGKSLFEQILCTHIALGREFLGLPVIQMNTLYVTCEDDRDELWRRQAAICEMLGVPILALKGKLHLVSLSGEVFSALAEPDSNGRLRPTEAWTVFSDSVKEHGIRLFAFDNATDAMAGDHNDVHQVAAFVNLLTGLALEIDGVAMILHHPNKAGDDWLGSVAWHNKVRSRLVIVRPDPNDPDLRALKAPKANYGPTGKAIEFRWHKGTFVREDDLPGDTRAELAAVILMSGENAAFLACLRERAAQGEGRQVGPSPGPNYAPAQFEGMAAAKGYKRAALKRAMDRLFSLGEIEAHTYRNVSKARDVTIIREVSPTTPNACPNPSRTPFPNDPEPQPERPRAHTHISKDISGAATSAAAPVDDELGWPIEEAQR